MVDAIFKNWKTSLAGILSLALVAAFLMGRINLTQFMTSVATVSGLGNILSKDG